MPNTKQNNKNKKTFKGTKKIFVHPDFLHDPLGNRVGSGPRKLPFTYPDVNSDKNLRKNVTDHYYDMMDDLLQQNKLFKSIKKHKPLFNTKKGYKLIYNILRFYTKKYNINWYDLRSQNKETLEYLAFKLNSVLNKE